MQKKYTRLLISLGLILIIFYTNCTVPDTPPHNVILFIGDGMGSVHVDAARMFHNGDSAPLSFETMQYKGEVTTFSADNQITDSAAAASAMATGEKVNNGVISQAIPGDGSDLDTVLEDFQQQGKAVGLVTTTFITHATPVAFAAHSESRENYSEIGLQLFSITKPEILMGGGANGVNAQMALDAGYTVITDRISLWSSSHSDLPLSGQFGNTHLPYEYDGLGSIPHLTEMTKKAIELLEEDIDGFFLMVEGGKIDHGGHANDLTRTIYEVIEFSNAVEAVIKWARFRFDTLILVTSDHETGGLVVTKNNGIDSVPDHLWTTVGHTDTNVSIYGNGRWAVSIHGKTIDNTDIYSILKGKTIK